MKQVLLTTVALVFLAMPTRAGTVVIDDGTFNNADYEVVLDGSSAISSSVPTQVPFGGNPSTFREVANSATQSSIFSFATIAAYHFNIAQPYDPANGAILSLDYSEDSILFSGPALEGHLALRQDGILYRSEQSFTPGTSSSAFTNNLLAGLVEADFEAYFNGQFFPTADPDFSTSGGIIEFGFLRYDVLNTFSNSIGIDNFRVELSVEEIPEPAGVYLYGTCLLGMILSRRWWTQLL